MNEEQNEGQSLLDGIKIWAKVGVELGETMKKQQATNEALWRKLQFSTPVVYRNQVSGVCPSSGTLLLNLGSPDQGYQWQVHAVAVGGTDINVTANGKFGIYISGYVGNNVSPGLGALVDGAEWGEGTASMPFTNQYGSDQMIINDSENYYVVITGGTSGQTYMASMSATVINVAATLGNTFNVL